MKNYFNRNRKTGKMHDWVLSKMKASPTKKLPIFQKIRFRKMRMEISLQSPSGDTTEAAH